MPESHCTMTLAPSMSSTTCLLRLLVLFQLSTLLVLVAKVVRRPRRQMAKEVIVGKSVLLECDFLYPRGVLIPHQINWIKNNEHPPIFTRIESFEPALSPNFKGRIKIRSGATILIERIQPEDQGTYRCLVKFNPEESGDGEVHSAIYLFVFDFPKIVSQLPTTLVKKPHSKVHLTCKVTGRPHPDIVWYHNAERVVSDDIISVSQGGDLQISSVGFQHGGLYECVATNKLCSDSVHITLLIEGGVYIQNAPQNVTLKENARLELPCSATGHPKNISYHWFKGTRDLNLVKKLRDRYMTDSGTLIIPTVHRFDSGWYRCLASNGQGSPPQASAFVNVIHLPKFEGFTQRTQFLSDKRQGLIQCPVLANPTVKEVQWTHNYTDKGITTVPFFTIAKVKPSNSGVWKCKCYNELGWSDWSYEIRVLVQAIPHFTQRPMQVVQKMVGHDVNIVCNLDKLSYYAQVHWYKDNKPIHNLRATPMKRLLEIKRLEPSDSGFYQCLINNTLVHLFAQTHLLVETRPIRSPFNLTGTTDAFSAHLRWIPGYDNARVLHYSIWFKLVSMRTWSTLSVPTKNYFYVSVFGLIPSSQYCIFVKTSTLAGIALESEKLYIRTKPITTDFITQADITGIYPELPNPPSDVSLEMINGRQIRIHWAVANSSIHTNYFLIQYAAGDRAWRSIPPVYWPKNDHIFDALTLDHRSSMFLYFRVATCSFLACSKPSSEVTLDTTVLMSDLAASYKLDVGMTTLWALVVCASLIAIICAAVILWNRCTKTRSMTRMTIPDSEQEYSTVDGDKRPYFQPKQLSIEHEV